MGTYDEYRKQTYSYLALRNTVGWIGILLPFVLVAGVYLFSDSKPILRTISLYYHSVMRDVFVGSICAIALFMFFYRGYTKFDNRAGSLAGVFAIGIALFPTVREGPNDWIGTVHFVCAIGFFLILSGFSIFLFTRKKAAYSRRKLIRNKIYIACGLVMIASLLAIMFYFIFFDYYNSSSCFVFWAESLALIAFGISWLTKGGTIFPDRRR